MTLPTIEAGLNGHAATGSTAPLSGRLSFNASHNPSDAISTSGTTVSSNVFLLHDTSASPLPALLPRPRERSGTAVFPNEGPRHVLEGLSATPSRFGPFPIHSEIADAHPGLASAFSCPDLFLLAAPDTTARRDAIVALARMTNSRGERVLLLTEDSASSDRLLEQLHGAGISGLLRAIGEGEDVHALSELSRAHTATSLLEQERAKERNRLESATRKLEERLSFATLLWHIAARIATAQAEHDRVAIVVGKDDPAISDAIAIIHGQRVEKYHLIDTQERTLRAELTQTESALAEIQRPAGGSFFKKLFGGKPTLDPAAVQRVETLRGSVQTLTDRLQLLGNERNAAEAEYQTALEQIIAAEVANRQAEFDRQLGQLTAEASLIRSSGGFEHEEPDQERLNGELEQARQKLAEFEIRHTDVLSESVISNISIVVGHLGINLHDIPFIAHYDLLILTHGESLAESDFLAAGRSASRWVVIGQPTALQLPSSPRPYRNGKPLPRGSFFEWAWQESNRLPFMVDSSRLLTTLNPVPANRSHSIWSEPLADRPDIQLYFFENETGSAVLSSVAFPAGTALLDAKVFLTRELGEARFHTFGLPVWRETEKEIVCRWPAVEGDICHDGLSLGNGGCEVIAARHGLYFTQEVVFARQEGWTRETAEEWLLPRSSSNVRTAVYAVAASSP